MMTLKEKIENNIAIFMLAALFSGFMAGIATYKGILEIAKLETISKAELKELQKKLIVQRSKLKPPHLIYEDLGH